MKRFSQALIPSILLASFLSACAPIRHNAAIQTPAAPRGAVCDTASADVTTFGRATAKLYADVALKREAADLRGHMFAGGVRRIRAVQNTHECRPFGSSFIVANVFQCTSRVQLCGR